jgi:hypothetical protein
MFSKRRAKLSPDSQSACLEAEHIYETGSTHLSLRCRVFVVVAIPVIAKESISHRE